MPRLYFALHDTEASAPIPISIGEANSFNEKGYGIFCTVNSFKNNSRTLAHLDHILAWYVDLDGGDKASQLALIQQSPIYPSLVVESGNGYHVYFHAKDAQVSQYREIQDRLVFYFTGDKRARDASRILRVPGYLHLKDPANPFLVRQVSQFNVTYSDKEMLYFFASVPKAVDAPKTHEDYEGSVLNAGRDLSHKLDNLNNLEALRSLSGKPCVNHEQYEFKPVGKNRHNILVNGKSTSCFIDEHGKIGAVPGGPTLFSWLKYYGHSDSEVARILRQELNL